MSRMLISRSARGAEVHEQLHQTLRRHVDHHLELTTRNEVSCWNNRHLRSAEEGTHWFACPLSP